MANITQGYIYNYATIDSELSAKSVGIWYVVTEDKIAIKGRLRIDGTEYDGAGGIVYIDAPFNNPMGNVEYFSGGNWLNADCGAFVVTPQAVLGWYGDGFETYLTAAIVGDGWVSFEKSFGFNTSAETVLLFGVVRDTGGNEFFTPLTIPVKSGLYLPDYAPLAGFDAFVTARISTGPEMDFIYPNTVIENAVFNQQLNADIKQIAPETGISRFSVGGSSYAPRVIIRSITKPTQTFNINYATCAGVSKVLMPDGTIRLIICNRNDRKFDVYKSSNTGVDLMFDDLWDETYHAAQLAWLIDGTLVSYAWQMEYFEGDESKPAGIYYSLYFKRSLDDGGSWEIPILAKDKTPYGQGLPILTQEPQTGKITIGNAKSDDMGLTWY